MITNKLENQVTNMLCLGNWAFERRNQNKGNRNNKPIVIEENLPEL